MHGIGHSLRPHYDVDVMHGTKSTILGTAYNLARKRKENSGLVKLLLYCTDCAVLPTFQIILT